MLSPGCEYCADCYEEARRICFDRRCEPCRLDIWVSHLNKREVLADNQPLKRCADCGGEDLRRLSFKQWVARMAAIRKLQKKYDFFYRRCEVRSGVRIQRLIARGDRNQSTVIFGSLDDQLPEDHRARVVDDVVQGMDLREFYAEISSRMVSYRGSLQA